MRRAGIWLIVVLPLVAVLSWVANHTYWGDTTLPLPPKGEALTNPFYAVQRFTEALGSKSSWDRVFTAPPADSVLVISAWHWSLSTPRREAIKRWVESGGRLVVDASLLDDQDDFERWSGITEGYREEAATRSRPMSRPEELCRTFREERDGRSAGSNGARAATRYWLCDFDPASFLTAKGRTLWAVRDDTGIQALRVAVGRGHVTVINGSPFRYRGLFDGDHGRLFVAATELRRHDDVHMLSEDDHPSLLALIWRYGDSVVVLTLGLIGLALWRDGVRLGPIAAPLRTARRSLAEQIRGTGGFALRHGGGDALHAAAVRALDEAAARRVAGYATLSAKERGSSLAHVTGLDRDALLKAIHHEGARRPNELHETIALLEAARRLTLVEPAKGLRP